MLQLQDIVRTFGMRKVLDGVSLSVEDGEMVGLIGPSSGGKSVLLKILGGVITPDTGEISYSSTGHGARPSIGLMFQEGALFDSLDVFNNVAFPLVSGRVPTFLLGKAEQAAVSDKVHAILERVGLSNAVTKLPGQISGGMRKRVALARALVARPELVLLDDPTSGLDPVASSVIMNLVAELHGEYRPTMVIVSHDLRRLFSVVSKIHALFDGAMRFSGSVSELGRTQNKKIHAFVSCRYDFH